MKRWGGSGKDRVRARERGKPPKHVPDDTVRK